MNIKDRWFLLYGGCSSDGRGTPEFEGRTTSIEEAAKHFRSVNNSAYSFGCVDIVSDTDLVRVWKIEEITG